jgi:tRNA 2-selenouridine synthase SelU
MSLVPAEQRMYRTQQTGKQLREAYRDLDTTFIINFVDELYDGNEDLDDLENKYGIIVIQKDGDDYVTGAAYYPDLDKYTLAFSDVALETIDSKLDKDELYNQVEAAIVHEYVHKQQNQLNSKNQKIIRAQEDLDEYYKQKHEIDAYAKGITHEWLQKLNRQNAIGKLKNNDFSDLSDDTQYLIGNYKRLGQEPFKRLLSEIYRQLYQEPSTYQTDELALKNTLKTQNLID